MRRIIITTLLALWAGPASADTLYLFTDLTYGTKILMDNQYETFDRYAEINLAIELDRTYRIVDIEREEAGKEFTVDLTVTEVEPELFRATYLMTFGVVDQPPITREVNLLMQLWRGSETKINNTRELLIVKAKMRRDDRGDSRAKRPTEHKLKPRLKVHPGTMVPEH